MKTDSLEKGLTSARLIRNPRILLGFSLICLVMLTVTIVGLIEIPWTQNVFAEGQVAVYDPMDRPQSVDAQLRGRLVRIEVLEGQIVEEGELLAVLDDRDPRFLDPKLNERLEAQLKALQDKRSAIRDRLEALDEQTAALETSRAAQVPSAEVRTVQSLQQLEAMEQRIRLAEQTEQTARLQQERLQTLFDEGLRSARDLELAVQDMVSAQTELQRLRAEREVTRSSIEIARFDVTKIEADLTEKLVKISEEKAKARESLADLEEKLQKLENERSTLVERRSLQELRAPRSGRVVNLKKVGPGQMLAEGEVLATISPLQQELGVELFVKGLDVPLVQPGRPVRVMFEGFPAVPFVGWPWASVGTFGGIVTFVDPIATPRGADSAFRVWVRPDPAEQRWPYREKLLLGSKAAGWILLDEVPLYYEIWRQLNAFPAKPVLDGGGSESSTQAKPKPVIRR